LDKKRIVITGLGAVTPLGCGIEAFWKGLVEGKCGIRPISFFDAGRYQAKVAGEVPDFKPEN